jgi:integrative and conjugative element protein (TIGR02256 family)
MHAPDPLTRVWIAGEDADQLIAQARRHGPLETGGIVLGYRVEGGREIVITHLVGPGPRAQHMREGFAPDTAYQEAEIERIFAETDRRSIYLGDWHSHPGRAPMPSRKDEGALRRIARYQQAEAPNPLMLIAGLENGETTLAAWVGHPGWLRFRVEKAATRIYRTRRPRGESSDSAS